MKTLFAIVLLAAALVLPTAAPAQSTNNAEAVSVVDKHDGTYEVTAKFLIESNSLAVSVLAHTRGTNVPSTAQALTADLQAGMNATVARNGNVVLNKIGYATQKPRTPAEVLTIYGMSQTNAPTH